MSTRSALFIQNDDSSWTRIYCHYDGNPQHMLPALAKADPQQILDAKEIRQIHDDGTVEGFPVPRAPETMDEPAMPEWADHAYIMTYPNGWRHARTTDALTHWAIHAA